MIYEFFTDIFPYEKFPVEFECYKQLKQDDSLNYIAVPWTQILNSSWLNFPNRQPSSYYLNVLNKKKIEQADNFTVCQHDNYMSLLPLFRHLNITKVFSPLHDSTNIINGLKVVPISFTSCFDFESVKKDILFSFVGTYTSHPIRERMRKRIQGDHILYRSKYHIDPDIFTGGKVKISEEIEYKNILERSRYSLCPRGSSPSSVRFWESLHAGAIPILISDNWCLPEWDWDHTILHIKEKDFERMDYKAISDLLESIDVSRESTMRENCYKAHEKFKKEEYRNYILSNL